MNAVTGSSPAQLPLVIGRRNTGVGTAIEWVYQGANYQSMFSAIMDFTVEYKTLLS